MQHIYPIVGAIFVSVIAGIILWLIQKERFSLLYEVFSSELFPHSRGDGRYFIIKLKNSGNKPINNIFLKVSFQTGAIESIAFSENELAGDIKENEKNIQGIIPLLNPREILSITITTVNVLETESPEIKARAVGVTAIEQPQFSEAPQVILWSSVLATTVAILSGFAIIWSSSSNSEFRENISGILKIKDDVSTIQKEIKQRNLGEPDSGEIVFANLNKAGIGYLFPKLLSYGQIEFWKTGIFLFYESLSDDKNQSKYIDVMEQLANLDSGDSEQILPASRGFILYLLAKIYQHQGIQEKAVETLKQCKKVAPLMYEYMMAQDPAFDLNKIKESLKSKWSVN